MRKQLFAAAAILLSSTVLFVLLCLLTKPSLGHSKAALAAPGDAPTVTEANPSFAPNDLDTPIAITGTGFAAGLSGTLTLVITTPAVYLGDMALGEVSWVSSTTLKATIPWGLDPGVYTLTVQNPDGETGFLLNAFTVTQGIGVWITDGPYGGYIADLVLHPVTSTKIYAMVGGSGLFVSHDGATHWEHILLHHGPPGAILEMDAQNPDVMYVGDIMKRTMDRGNTWEMILEAPPGCVANPAAHPTLSGVVYAATSLHIDLPIQPGNECGVFRSDDYGRTWEMLDDGLTDTHVIALAFHPDDPNIMLAGTRNGNIFSSDDGGEYWSWKAQVSNHVEKLYFNPYGSHEAWATTESYGAKKNPAHYLYKSEDPELITWVPIDVIEPQEVGALYFTPNEIWAAAGRIYTSTDLGENWSNVVGAGLPQIHWGIQQITLDPSDPDIIYIGDIGEGVFKSYDGGSTWESTNDGLTGVTPNTLAVNPVNPDVVYTDTPALGLLRSDAGGRSWRSMGFCHVGAPRQHFMAADPFTPTRVYHGDDLAYAMGVWISEDSGVTWREVTTTLPITLADRNISTDSIVPHPNVPGRILAGVSFWAMDNPGPTYEPPAGIYVSDDYGETWQRVGPTQLISRVLDFAYNAVDTNLVYAASHGKGLWTSTDGGTEWRQVTSFPGSLYVSTVAAHPEIGDTIYVLAGGELGSLPALYVSYDAGETWENILDGAYGLEIAPPQPGASQYTIYTSYEDGLWRSRDGGRTWEHIEELLNNGITAIATGGDGQRAVVYVGVPGGVVMVEGQDEDVFNLTLDEEKLVDGGIYRLTTILPTDLVYLPIISK